MGEWQTHTLMGEMEEMGKGKRKKERGKNCKGKLQ